MAFELRRDELVGLLSQLVRAPSYPGVPNQEQEVVRLLGDFLASHSLPSHIDLVAPGRPVAGIDDLYRLLTAERLDAACRVELLRDGRRINLDVIPRERR